MGRIILGVIVGFIVWTIIWFLVDPVVRLIAPNMMPNPDLTNIQTGFLVILIIASIICSLAAGFLAVLVSKEQSKTTLYLGILLLLVGIFFQTMAWSLFPLWYHLIFLILLIPVTILGGKLSKTEPLIS